MRNRFIFLSRNQRLQLLLSVFLLCSSFTPLFLQESNSLDLNNFILNSSSHNQAQKEFLLRSLGSEYELSEEENQNNDDSCHYEDYTYKINLSYLSYYKSNTDFLWAKPGLKSNSVRAPPQIL